ncbi:MAG TPA: HesA/MoeB/ThiF family protein [Gammaproteobacteria bacterium]|nr:HesA/MoeB/ThiF family protein [Gammaproteobacteria bacterium]
MELNTAEKLFYAKQIMLPDVGIEGQLKLKNTRVLCIGAGGLGSPLLQTLVSAGIGKIGIVDHDVVELSNLQRQILYRYEDVNLKKVSIAKKYLQKLNPHIDIVVYPEKFDVSNARELIAQYDIIADCTDYLANRYLVNQICMELNKSFVFAGIWQHQGQCMLFQGKQGPCFECLFPADSTAEVLSDCNELGVLAVLPNLLGTLQANLIIQHVLKLQNSLPQYFYHIDISNLEFRPYSVEQNLQCRVCGVNKIAYPAINIISIETLKHKLANTENFILLDVRSREEHEIQNLGGILIPLPELSSRIAELDPAIPVIVYCRTDVRSQMAAHILCENNFTSVAYLKGGITAWTT